jgi:hypothetical protein
MISDDVTQRARKALLMTLTLLAASALFAFVLPSASFLVWYFGAVVLMPVALLWSAAYRGVVNAIATTYARLSNASLLYKICSRFVVFLSGILAFLSALLAGGGSHAPPPCLTTDLLLSRQTLLLASSLLSRAPPRLLA